MTAQDLLDDWTTLLNDGGVRWTPAEGLRWLNESQRQVVALRPDASVVSVPLALVAGTKQSLPAGALRLIDMPRNTGGDEITAADRDEFDRMVPGWHRADAQDAVQHYMTNPLDPKRFYVYPPVTDGVSVEAVYSVPPADCATAASSLGLDDIYAPAVLDGMLHRAFSKNGKGADPAKARGYLESMIARITGRTQADGASTAGHTKAKQVLQAQGTV